MKKLVNVVCMVCLLAGAVCGETREEEAMVSVLSGVHGLNRASVCVVSEGEESVRRCEGALLNGQWAIGRASCLLSAPATSLRVVRDSDGLSCADVEIDWDMQRVNHVSVVVRPSLHQDLVLMTLSQPYVAIDTYANSSNVDRFLKKWEPWLQCEGIMKARLPPSLGHQHVLISTPMRMLVTTVLLPMLSFIALFVFVVFCTGPRDPIPYQAIGEAEIEKTNLLGV